MSLRVSSIQSSERTWEGILFPCILSSKRQEKLICCPFHSWLSWHDFLCIIFSVMSFAVLGPALYVLYKTKSSAHTICIAHGCCIYSCLCNYLCADLGGVFILSFSVSLLPAGFNSNINLPGREESGSAPTSPSLQLQDKNANNHSTHSSSPAPIENGNQISNGERGLFESQQCFSNGWLVVFFVWTEAEDENRNETLSSCLLCGKLRKPPAGIADTAYLIKNECSFLAQNRAFKGNFSQLWEKFSPMQYFFSLFCVKKCKGSGNHVRLGSFSFLLCKYYLWFGTLSELKNIQHRDHYAHFGYS